MFWCWTESPLYRDHPISRLACPVRDSVSETGWVGAVAIRGLAVGTTVLLGTSGLERSGPLEWLSPRERGWTQGAPRDVFAGRQFCCFKVR